MSAVSKRVGARAPWWALPVAALLAFVVCAAVAALLIARSDGGGAVRALEAEIRAHPDRVAPRLELASIRAAEGRTFAAIEQLEAARSLGHETAAARLAELYERLGGSRPAGTASALPEPAGDATGPLERGRAAFADGDPWTAERIWASAAAEPRTGDAAARALTRESIAGARSRFDYETALRRADAACARWPDDPAFAAQRAELLLDLGRPAEARELALRLPELLPASRRSEAGLLLLRAAAALGDAELLLRTAREVEGLAPKEPTPHLLVGEHHQARGKDGFKEALEAYRKAVAAAPENPEARARLGALLARFRRHDQAVTALHEALDRAPRVLDGEPSLHLARIYRHSGHALEAEFHERRYARLQGAKREWDRLVPALRRSSPATEYRALGRAALERGEAWVALCAFRRGAGLAPDDAEMRRGLAAARRLLNRATGSDELPDRPAAG
jgi:tetratricopeptide (TPR) repeat protein